MFKLTDQPIISEKLASCLEDDRAGAMVSFTGKVRNHNEGRQVRFLSYEAFPEGCQEEANKIIEEAIKRFDLFKVEIVHRFGDLELGDAAVWVGTLAAHRQEAFAACQYVIDEIKKRLPIWKKEHYLEGHPTWLGDHYFETNRQKNVLQQQNYYSRQLCLPGLGLEGQQRLQKAKVLVVGAGALGCAALQYLASAGVGAIEIVDGDRLEISNLHRQTLYCYRDIGQPKAKLAAERLKAINPFIHISSESKRLDSANIDEIASASDIIVDCCDNFASKFLLHDYGYFHDIPIVSAAIHQNEGQLNIFHRSAKGCLRCLWPKIPDDNCIGNCQESGIIGAVAGVLGSLQAHEVIKLLLDWPVDKQHTLLLDLMSHELQLIERDKNPHCPLCGKNQKIKYIGDEAHVQSKSTKDFFDILPRDYRQKIQDFIVIDIREMAERSELCKESEKWIHMNLSCIDEIKSLPSHRNYLLICQTGKRSRRLCQELHQLGKTNYFSLKGGDTALKTSLNQFEI